MTEFLVDLASYQEGINLELVANSGFKLANIKTSQGNSYRWTNAGMYADIARGLNYTIGTFHWLDNSTSGAEQARIAFQGMKDLGGPDGMFHQCDCEDSKKPASYGTWRDYVNAMQDLLGRHIVNYTGDWWWTDPQFGMGNGASLTPYLWAAPNNGYHPSYPGDQAPEWYAGYGGWTDYSILQYAVQPISGAGGGDVSKSAIRDPAVIAALTGRNDDVSGFGFANERQRDDIVGAITNIHNVLAGVTRGNPMSYKDGGAIPILNDKLDTLVKKVGSTSGPTVDLAKLAADISSALIASNTNGLTQADHDAVVADVKKALREGVA